MNMPTHMAEKPAQTRQVTCGADVALGLVFIFTRGRFAAGPVQRVVLGPNANEQDGRIEQ